MKLKYSVFHEVLFPSQPALQVPQQLTLQQTYRLQIRREQRIIEVPWVIFDLETTGLSKESDRIIELGGTKYVQGQQVDQFSTLIYVDRYIPLAVQKLTGIDATMLEGKPTAATVIPEFMRFIEGALLVCHNSQFDMTMLGAELKRQNIVMNYPCVCTLKMARSWLAQLTSRKLSRLADHYSLAYDTLHRSLDDAELTAQVFIKMLEERSVLATATLGDLKPYCHATS